MTRGSVRQRWDARAHRCLGLHFWCKEYPGEPPSATREKRFTVPEHHQQHHQHRHVVSPAWPRTNAAGRDETRPASEVSGAVGKLSSPSCFPACLGIPPPGAGRPRTLIDHLLQFLSYSRLPASNPKPSIKWWTWNLRFSISDLEGRLWLLTPLVGLARNRERSAGFFPPHG